jgi:hypothetical protein
LKTKKLYEFIDIIIDIICVLMRILKIPVISRVSILLLTRLYQNYLCSECLYANPYVDVDVHKALKIQMKDTFLLYAVFS